APLPKTTAVTYEQFLAVQHGWTRNQLTSYLNNNPGEIFLQLSVSPGLFVQDVDYTNTNPNVTVGFSFRNNALVSKTQHGFKEKKFPITKAQYDLIQVGMTRDKVKTIVDNEGQLLGEGESDTHMVQYNGSGTGWERAVGPTVRIDFLLGKVYSKGANWFND
ncbi:unnamed protein product, partial [Didymodactylos carnosus]